MRTFLAILLLAVSAACHVDPGAFDANLPTVPEDVDLLSSGSALADAGRDCRIVPTPRDYQDTYHIAAKWTRPVQHPDSMHVAVAEVPDGGGPVLFRPVGADCPPGAVIEVYSVVPIPPGPNADTTDFPVLQSHREAGAWFLTFLPAHHFLGGYRVGLQLTGGPYGIAPPFSPPFAWLTIVAVGLPAIPDYDCWLWYDPPGSIPDFDGARVRDSDACKVP